MPAGTSIADLIPIRGKSRSRIKATNILSPFLF